MHWRRRHRDWYLDLVHQTMTEWRAGGHGDRLRMLRDDIANLRVALEFCVELPDETLAGLRMASSLYHYWLLTGLPGEGAYWIERMLAVATDPGPERVHGLYVAASLATLRGDLDAAQCLLDRAFEDGSWSDDPAGSAYLVQAQGLMALVRDDTELASELFDRSRQQLESAGDNTGSAFTTVLFSIVSMLRGESDRVAEAHDRCQRMTEPFGESWIWSFSLWVSGMDSWKRGEFAEAFELLRAALRLKRPLQDHLGIAECIEGIAWVTATSGQLQRAAVLLGAADSVWHAMGMSAGTVPGFHRHREESAKLARQLGLRPFQSAHREGSRLTFDEAIAFALEESVPRQDSGQGVQPTRREREIADLVAQGRSNKEIAEQLVLSRRTVEAHIQHLLTKLGFNSRSQVAAWVAHQNALRNKESQHEGGGVGAAQ